MRELLIPLILGGAAFSQTAPQFEAADVKINRSGEARMAVDFQPGGRFVARNVPMRVLIALSYKVRPEAVKGPGWIDSERYDIVAKAAQSGTPEEIRGMVHSLLVERFKLAAHAEDRESRGYALVTAKAGGKLQPSQSGLLMEQRCVPGDGAPEQRHYICRHMTMSLFAATIQEIAAREIDVPVVDLTGLKGAFDFRLDWVARAAGAPDDLAASPTLFEAVENQLGLKLESRKLPLPAIVVDAVERVPIEN